MIVGRVPKGTNSESIYIEMEEAQSLIKTYGGVVCAVAVQKSAHPDPSTFIGSGKAGEIAAVIAAEKIDIVVINDIVKPGQLYALEKIFRLSNPKIKVWDRVNLILQIFSLHAHTKEAKLQIDLAALRHMGSLLFGMGYILSRQGGGIGTVGVGETNTELMKRHWRDEMKHINKQLDKLSEERETQIKQRKGSGFSTVAIVGYTNAGKTMLFNRLTKKANFVADELFATLDSSVGKMTISGKRDNIVISDTIGFIKNIPAGLIDAFKSTLLESIHADLILILMDISDPEYREKIRVVDEILHELDLDKKSRLYVLNKVDKAASLDRVNLAKQFISSPLVFISAKTGEGMDELISKIGETIKTNV